jgi:hypothetical protein
MARKRIYKKPARVHVLTETETANQSRRFSFNQGFRSHNEYLNRLMLADSRRTISIACRAVGVAKASK